MSSDDYPFKQNEKKERSKRKANLFFFDIEQKSYDHFGVITFTIIFMFTLLIILNLHNESMFCWMRVLSAEYINIQSLEV